MNKKIFYILFFLFINENHNLNSWSITIHNNSDENITVGIGTTQNYPCGHWYAGYVDDWCNCGTTMAVNAKSTNSYSYGGVCVGACTSYLNIYDSKGVKVADQSKLAGGLTACSDVEAWTGKGSDGVWYIYTQDWTNNFMSWLNSQIVPALEQYLTAGFNLEVLIPGASMAANAGGQIGGKVNNLTSNLNVVIDFGKNIANQVNDLGAEINDFVNKTKITLDQLKSNFKDLVGGNYLLAIAKFLGQFQQLGITAAEATTLLTKIKTTHDSIISQIDNISLKPFLLAAKDLLKVVSVLINNIANIINAVPSFILSHSIVDPLQSVRSDLDNVNKAIDDLISAKIYDASQIESNLINGIFKNINNVGPAVGKILAQINIIVPTVNNLTNTIIPNIQKSVTPITDLFGSLKDKILPQLKKPENIAAMVPVVLTALPGSVFTLLTFGLALPVVAPAISASAQPLIKNITINLLKDAGLDSFVKNIKDLVDAINNIASAGTQATNIFSTDLGISYSYKSKEYLNNLTKLISKTANDVTVVSNAIPSLISW